MQHTVRCQYHFLSIQMIYNNSHLVAVIILLSDIIEYIVKVIFTALCMSHAFTSKVDQVETSIL